MKWNFLVKIKVWIKKNLDYINVFKRLDDIDKQLKFLNRLLEANSNLIHDNVIAIDSLSMCAVDVDITSRYPSHIIIVSKVKGGQVRIIPSHVKTVTDLKHLVGCVKHNYGVRDTRAIDASPHIQHYFNQGD